jgi:phosphoribosylformimino-5-aminoimidazole carboxamide ribotide isomerase
MILFPAIDLLGTDVVRLVVGDPEQVTRYDRSVISTARQWISEGAHWLHIVNLSAALGHDNNLQALLEQLAGLGANIQYGGGVRSLESMTTLLNLGITRVVVGTAALQSPRFVEEALDAFGPEKLCVALDSRNGQVTTHGWQVTSSIPTLAFAHQLASTGVRYALFTNVARDGTGSGVDLSASVALARETGLRIVASGGVGSLEDVRAAAGTGVLEGLVIGRALYDGVFSLREAFSALVND